ncbi:hypothetical protein SLA2020_048160 [Shorea laevis]
MIATPHPCSHNSVSFTVPLTQTPPLLNVMMTGATPFSCEQVANNSNNSNMILSGSRNTDHSIVGLLSEKVETQLSLGNKPTIGKKRSSESGPFEERFKRACFQPIEDVGMQCSPNQLQEALALGRSEFHIQDQEGFFKDVEELISIQ